MTLTAPQKNEIRKLIKLLGQLLEEPAAKKPAAKNGNGKRIRRSGAELSNFRKQLKSERKAGVSVAELAKKYGVSPAYIYQLQ